MKDQVYKDPEAPIGERIKDLLSRMSIEEKVGQMMQLPANQEGMMDLLEEQHIGSYLHCTGEMMRELQERAEKTRLGIPLIFGIDAIHGHCFENDGTVFPTQLAISCSWNKERIMQMGAVTAREVRAAGIHWTFSPVLCIGRDPRWGRIDETFGEDPWLIGEFAEALVKGYQGSEYGNSATESDKILACAKHYAAYGESTGGRDSYEAEVSRRKMRGVFLPPFEKAVKKAGCATLMAGYQAIDGLPCSANPWLLRRIAKEEWGLEGFIVTDWNNTGNLYTKQNVVENLKEAAYLAIVSGNDMIMSTPSFYENAVELIKEGRVDESLIDDSVARILRAKFSLGLFDEHRHSPPGKKAEVFGAPDAVQASLQASRESLVLLKNEGVLPLSAKNGLRILLTGANADDVVAQLGDWSFGSMQAGAANDSFHRNETVTLLSGLKMKANEFGGTVQWIKGADPVDPKLNEIEAAGKAAEDADAVIVCVGDTLPQHGEFHDRSNLNLTGYQSELVQRVKMSGKPLIVVFLASKPLAIAEETAAADALICAFNPGPKGGQALAELIFGEIEPKGRLTISFPYSAGQLPVHYNKYGGWHCSGGEEHPGTERYIDLPEYPLFSFGEGMSYSKVHYGSMELDKAVYKKDDCIRIRQKLENRGGRPATAIVQGYVNDICSSLTTPVKELKSYVRIELAPGEEKTAELLIPVNELFLINADEERIVEPGEFEIMVGSSSRDEDLQKKTIRVE